MTIAICYPHSIGPDSNEMLQSIILNWVSEWFACHCSHRTGHCDGQFLIIISACVLLSFKTYYLSHPAQHMASANPYTINNPVDLLTQKSENLYFTMKH